MKTFLAFLLCAVMLFQFSFAMADTSDRTADDYPVPLYTLAEKAGFKIGICLSPNQLGLSDYTSVLTRHFNTTTCTNETKAYSLLDQAASKRSSDGMPRMNYTVADRMVKWAMDHGIGVRGHVLTWDAYMTEWFFHEGYDVNKPIASRDVILTRMESYITQVVTHFETQFPGVIYCWDVVNEAIGDNASEYNAADPRHIRTMRNGAPNPFYAYVGDDYVEYSFLYARNAVESLGADIKLFYNDYNMLYADKRGAAKYLVESINTFAAGDNGEYRVLIDGIGMQGYMGGYGAQSGCLSNDLISNTRASILAYASMGMEVHITEMALRNYDESLGQEHAAFYGKMFEMLRGINEEIGWNCLTSVTIWGVNDVTPNAYNTYTWKLNSTFGGILTENNRIKTSFDAMYDVLAK
ncbi:MAG: endo-1,4-beta-xylanase [Clostridia bacterium]|nr:endo-1,4-beta-xylanase [Clostridia bacterium]